MITLTIEQMTQLCLRLNSMETDEVNIYYRPDNVLVARLLRGFGNDDQVTLIWNENKWEKE